MREGRPLAKKKASEGVDAERDSDGRTMKSLLDGVFTVPNPNLPSQIGLPKLLELL